MRGESPDPFTGLPPCPLLPGVHELCSVASPEHPGLRAGPPPTSGILPGPPPPLGRPSHPRRQSCHRPPLSGPQSHPAPALHPGKLPSQSCAPAPWGGLLIPTLASLHTSDPILNELPPPLHPRTPGRARAESLLQLPSVPQEGGGSGWSQSSGGDMVGWEPEKKQRLGK